MKNKVDVKESVLLNIWFGGARIFTWVMVAFFVCVLLVSVISGRTESRPFKPTKELLELHAASEKFNRIQSDKWSEYKAMFSNIWNAKSAQKDNHANSTK